jgi:large subunit ribosomal protein L17e
MLGMKLTKAYKYLGDVSEHKQAIPYRRFNGGVGRTAQVKVFKTTQGAFQIPQLTSTPSNLSNSLDSLY